MTRPDQEAIDTFMSITGVSEATAVQKLEEHLGNLNEAINAHFTEGDRNITQEVSFIAPSDDVMDIDDPIPVEAGRPSSLLFPSARDLNPFSLLDPNYSRSIFDSDIDIMSRSPFVSQPRNVREIPIEVKDGDGAPRYPRNAPTIEEVTDTEHDLGREIHGTIIVDDEDDVDKNANRPSIGASRYGEYISSVNAGPSAPTVVDVPDYSNDIEEEMIRAAIEASRQDAKISNQQLDGHLVDLTEPNVQSRQSHQEDTDLEHAVSLSLQTAEQEKALRELEENAGASEVRTEKHSGMEEPGEATSSIGRKTQLEVGDSSIQVDAKDVENQPLVRRRRRRISSVPVETSKDIENSVAIPPSSPHNNVNHSQRNGDDFAADVWGGISSEEHDEAVMLEAAMFGGIPEGSEYHFPYAPQLGQNGFDRTMGPYLRHAPRPPSPSLTAQRLLREQQDDEYFASLQADREKELKAKEEAEAVLAEEKRKEDYMRSQLLEKQEIERQLAAKEASLPREPALDDENAVTLLVRMPDGSRRGRRFLKSDKLQYLFDFIDVSRAVKLGSYRLVRPYPRRAFSDAESTLTLNELGLTSKQEALYLELI